MAWLLRRLGMSLLLVWVVASIVFLAIHLVPGDPAELLLSQGGTTPDAAAVAELRAQLDLDLPLLQQYAHRMWSLLRLDLGRSIQDDSQVMDSIPRPLPPTLALIRAAT